MVDDGPVGDRLRRPSILDRLRSWLKPPPRLATQDELDELDSVQFDQYWDRLQLEEEVRRLKRELALRRGVEELVESHGPTLDRLAEREDHARDGRDQARD